MTHQKPRPQFNGESWKMNKVRDKNDDTDSFAAEIARRIFGVWE